MVSFIRRLNSPSPRKPWKLTLLPKTSLEQIWTWKILLKYIQMKTVETKDLGVTRSWDYVWMPWHRAWVILNCWLSKCILASPQRITNVLWKTLFCTLCFSRSDEMDAKTCNSASLKIWTSQSTSVRLPRCHRPDDILRYKIHL